MSTILKFKEFSSITQDNTTGQIGNGIIRKLDVDKTYSNNDEVIFTNIPLNQFRSKEKIDQQNFEKIKRNLVMNIQSSEMQNFIDGFNISKVPKDGVYNPVMRRKLAIDQCLEILSNMFLQFNNLLLWNFTQDENGNVTQIQRQETIAESESEQLLLSYMPDLTAMFEAIILAKVDTKLVLRKIAIDKERMLIDRNQKIGETTKNVSSEIKQKKSRKSKKVELEQ